MLLEPTLPLWHTIWNKINIFYYSENSSDAPEITFLVDGQKLDQKLIADQRNLRDKYLQNDEENWTKK